MSAILFETQPGRLVAVRSNNPKSLKLDLGGVERTGVLVGLNMSGKVAFQAQPSLDRAVYLIPFGDEIGRVSVQMILNSACDDEGGERGTDAFLDHYASNRFSPTNTKPVRLTIGRKVFVGYAVNFEVSATSASGDMFTGQIDFAAWMAM